FILTAFCTRAAVVSTPSASPTPATSGNLTGLIFDTSETEERLTEIDRCTREFAQGWTHTPYEINDSSYSAMWCNRGFQQSGCFTPDLSNLSEEQYLIELSTDFYNNEFPKVHGFELRAVFIPRSPNWGVDFHLKQGGANSAHDGFGMAFTYYSTAVPAISLVSLGDDYEYEVHETDVVLPAGLPPVNELADYIESAESMRDRGVARLMRFNRKSSQQLHLTKSYIAIMARRRQAMSRPLVILVRLLMLKSLKPSPKPMPTSANKSNCWPTTIRKCTPHCSRLFQWIGVGRNKSYRRS
ncbi:MAG TPA: hypothetical protein VI547_08855, partial [Anaerolineales bacterium]|nr:hypothetical protein [Anaerolineales bacterium]